MKKKEEVNFREFKINRMVKNITPSWYFCRSFSLFKGTSKELYVL